VNDAERAEARSALVGALITEGVSIGAVVALWALIRYRDQLRARARQVVRWRAGRDATLDAALAEAYRENSRMEHSDSQDILDGRGL
jgi:hypothetical protein